MLVSDQATGGITPSISNAPKLEYHSNGEFPQAFHHEGFAIRNRSSLINMKHTMYLLHSQQVLPPQCGLPRLTV